MRLFCLKKNQLVAGKCYSNEVDPFLSHFLFKDLSIYLVDTHTHTHTHTHRENK